MAALRGLPPPRNRCFRAGGAGSEGGPRVLVPASVHGSTPRRWARAGNHTALPRVGRSQYEKVAFHRPTGGLILLFALRTALRRLQAVPSSQRATAPGRSCECAEEGTSLGRTSDSWSLSSSPDSLQEGALI